MHSTAESKVVLDCFPYIAIYFPMLRKQNPFCLISDTLVGEVDLTCISELIANNVSMNNLGKLLKKKKKASVTVFISMY